MPFTALDGTLIADLGVDVVFTPNGGSVPEDVRVIRKSASGNPTDSPFLVLFGTIADSGFSRAPAKDDKFTVDDVEYTAFDVQGPDTIGGYRISLTK